MKPIISVEHLTKAYKIFKKEEGVLGAVKGLLPQSDCAVSSEPRNFLCLKSSKMLYPLSKKLIAIIITPCLSCGLNTNSRISF